MVSDHYDFLPLCSKQAIRNFIFLVIIKPYCKEKLVCKRHNLFISFAFFCTSTDGGVEGILLCNKTPFNSFLEYYILTGLLRNKQ